MDQEEDRLSFDQSAFAEALLQHSGEQGHDLRHFRDLSRRVHRAITNSGLKVVASPEHGDVAPQTGSTRSDATEERRNFPQIDERRLADLMSSGRRKGVAAKVVDQDACYCARKCVDCPCPTALDAIATWMILDQHVIDADGEVWTLTDSAKRPYEMDLSQELPEGHAPWPCRPRLWPKEWRWPPALTEQAEANAQIAARAPSSILGQGKRAYGE